MCEQGCLQAVLAHAPGCFPLIPIRGAMGKHSSSCQGYVELGAGGKAIPAPTGAWILHSPSNLLTLHMTSVPVTSSRYNASTRYSFGHAVSSQYLFNE